MKTFNFVKTGNVVGIISIVFFLLCMIWGTIFTDPILKELHQNILKIMYPGFVMTLTGIIIAIIEAFIYGWILGALFNWLYQKQL